jgi:hypothetical protein
MTPTTGWAGGEDELLAMLRKFEAIGTARRSEEHQPAFRPNREVAHRL